MAYFNNAFQKTGLVAEIYGAADLATTGLTPGQLGLVDADDYETVAFPTGNTDALPNKFLLVQGNWTPIADDTLGNNPAAGGYSESIKSKIIQAKYINKVWKQECVSAVASTPKAPANSAVV